MKKHFKRALSILLTISLLLSTTVFANVNATSDIAEEPITDGASAMFNGINLPLGIKIAMPNDEQSAGVKSSDETISMLNNFELPKELEALGAAISVPRGSEPIEFTPEMEMIYEAIAIGLFNYASIISNTAFDYDPNVNYSELLGDDTFQMRFTPVILSFGLGDPQQIEGLLDTAGFAEEDIEVFLERWAIALARTPLAKIHEKLVMEPAARQSAFAELVMFTVPNGPGMTAVLLGYYDTLKASMFDLSVEAAAQDIFGMSYAEAETLYFGTQEWDDFQNGVVSVLQGLTDCMFDWVLASYMHSLAEMNGIEVPAFTSEVEMVINAFAAGVMHYSMQENFVYDPNVNYSEIFEFDSSSYGFFDLIISHQLGSLHKLNELLTAINFPEPDIESFVKQWAVAFARMPLMSIVRMLLAAGDNKAAAFAHLLGSDPIADAGLMLTTVFDYYDSFLIGFFETIMDALAQEMFGENYANAEALYSETQEWSAFEGTVNSFKDIFTYTYTWVLATYFKNLAAMNDIEVPEDEEPEPLEFTPEMAMIYEAIAIGLFDYSTVGFVYDPNINYNELLGDDVFQRRTTPVILTFGLGNMQQFEELLDTVGFMEKDIELFLERWTVAFARTSLADIRQILALNPAARQSAFAELVMFTNPNGDDMVASLLDYYDAVKDSVIQFAIKSAAQDTFGMSYEDAEELFFETQEWDDFQNGIVLSVQNQTDCVFDWVISSYLKNLTDLSETEEPDPYIFTEAAMVQEAIGIGTFELLFSAFGIPFRHDPSISYGGFGSEMFSFEEAEIDIYELILGYEMGSAALMQTALMDAGYTSTEAAAFIERVAEVFAYQSLHSIKKAFTSDDAQAAFVGVLTTPALAEDIEGMVEVMLERYIDNFIECFLNTVESAENEETEEGVDDQAFINIFSWVWASYLQNFAAINHIDIPPGSITPDVYPIRNYALKENLARTGITIGFAEAEGVDIEEVEVDEIMMQALLDSILAQDIADLGTLFHNVLLAEDANPVDLIVLLLIVMLLDSVDLEELDGFSVYELAEILRTLASFSSGDVLDELDEVLDEVSDEEETGISIEMGDVELNDVVDRVLKNVLLHFMGGWDSIREETEALFEEEDDTLDYVLAWVTALYIQNIVALNAEEPVPVKSGAALTKATKLNGGNAPAKRILDEFELEPVIDSFHLDSYEIYDILDVDYLLDSIANDEELDLSYLTENTEFVEAAFGLEGVATELVSRALADNDEFPIMKAMLGAASGAAQRSTANRSASRAAGGSVLRTASRAVLGAASSVLGGGAREGNDSPPGCEALGDAIGNITSCIDACAVETPVLNLDRSSWLPSTAAETINVTVESENSWTVTSDQDWLTVSELDDTTFSMTVTANDTLSERQGTVTVQNGGNTKTIAVVQDGPLALNLVDWEIDAKAAASDEITIKTILGWTIDKDQSWITLSKTSGTGNSTFTISVEPNGSGDGRTGTVTVDAGSGITKEITVTQSKIMSVNSDLEEFKKALQGISPYDVSGRYIQLQNNIDLGANWVAIDIDANNSDFTLDGNGYTLTMKSHNNFPPNGNNLPNMVAGLLGKVTNRNITIKRLGIVGSAVVVSQYNNGAANVHAGGLAAWVIGGSFTVENTYFMSINEGVRAERDRGSSAAYAYAGGFFGEVSDATITIKNCFVNADVTADTRTTSNNIPSVTHAGGFIGKLTGNTVNRITTISNSYAAGTVTSYANSNATPNSQTNALNYIGGLVGRLEHINNKNITNSYRFNRITNLFGSSTLREDESGISVDPYVSGDRRKPRKLSDAVDFNSVLATLENDGGNVDWRYSSGFFPTLAGVRVPQGSILDDVLNNVAGNYSATAANPYKDVAEMCIQIAGFDVYHHDAIENKLVNKTGFTHFEFYDYDTIPAINGTMINDTAQHAFAYKKMPNGTIVVMVAIRGTGTEHGLFDSIDTWVSNLISGGIVGSLLGEHRGFSIATNKVFANLKSYLWRNLLTQLGTLGGTLRDNVRIVITGHSRGGAVGNLLTNRLHGKYGDTTQSRMFNYNFAVPWTVGSLYVKSPPNILNINNTNDPVTTIIPVNPWGLLWKRHGRDINFTASGDPGVILSLGHHRAELYQREVIRNAPPFLN